MQRKNDEEDERKEESIRLNPNSSNHSHEKHQDEQTDIVVVSLGNLVISESQIDNDQDSKVEEYYTGAITMSIEDDYPIVLESKKEDADKDDDDDDEKKSKEIDTTCSSFIEPKVISKSTLNTTATTTTTTIVDLEKELDSKITLTPTLTPDLTPTPITVLASEEMHTSTPTPMPTPMPNPPSPLPSLESTSRVNGCLDKNLNDDKSSSSSSSSKPSLISIKKKVESGKRQMEEAEKNIDMICEIVKESNREIKERIDKTQNQLIGELLAEKEIEKKMNQSEGLISVPIQCLDPRKNPFLPDSNLYSNYKSNINPNFNPNFDPNPNPNPNPNPSNSIISASVDTDSKPHSYRYSIDPDPNVKTDSKTSLNLNISITNNNNNNSNGSEKMASKAVESISKEEEDNDEQEEEEESPSVKEEFRSEEKTVKQDGDETNESLFISPPSSSSSPLNFSPDPSSLSASTFSFSPYDKMMRIMDKNDNHSGRVYSAPHLLLECEKVLRRILEPEFKKEDWYGREGKCEIVTIPLVQNKEDGIFRVRTLVLIRGINSNSEPFSILYEMKIVQTEKSTRDKETRKDEINSLAMIKPLPYYLCGNFELVNGIDGLNGDSKSNLNSKTNNIKPNANSKPNPKPNLNLNPNLNPIPVPNPKPSKPDPKLDPVSKQTSNFKTDPNNNNEKGRKLERINLNIDYGNPEALKAIEEKRMKKEREKDESKSKDSNITSRFDLRRSQYYSNKTSRFGANNSSSSSSNKVAIDQNSKYNINPAPRFNKSNSEGVIRVGSVQSRSVSTRNESTEAKGNVDVKRKR